MTDPIEAKAKIVYQEALRVVEEQDNARDALRTRATVTVTVASLAASVLGFGDLEHNGLFFLGLGGLAAVTLSVAYIYAPWGWTQNPARLGSEDFIRDSKETPARVYDSLSRSHQENVEQNQEVMDRLVLASYWNLLGLLVLVVSWTINLSIMN